MNIPRRRVLASSAIVAGALSVGATLAEKPTAAAEPLPDPATSGLDHIVVVCMENRSFDHLLGWLPGADGKQAGLSFRDSSGAYHPTHHLTTTQGCQWADPSHSYAGGRVQFADGRCDGWLLASDIFSIGYYERDDLPFLGKAAPEWTVFDNFFASTMAPTFPNRLYLWGAQTDRTSNTMSFTSIPTIFDRLRAAGVSRRYYYSDVPFSAMWGFRYFGISDGFDDFLEDAASGNLPAVSYVEPALFLEAIDGLSNDYHPHGDIRNGDAFLSQVYTALTNSPAWPRTALVITFDEWGGFFDHVAPQAAPDTKPSLTGLRGFRVPTLIISPFARRHTVSHGLYDHTSILKMIEWRFGLSPLTPRDAAANNLAESLDFSQPDYSAPQWSVPYVYAPPCFMQGTAPGNADSLPTGKVVKPAHTPTADGPANAEWNSLREAAIGLGWRMKR